MLSLQALAAWLHVCSDRTRLHAAPASWAPAGASMYAEHDRSSAMPRIRPHHTRDFCRTARFPAFQIHKFGWSGHMAAAHGVEAAPHCVITTDWCTPCTTLHPSRRVCAKPQCNPQRQHHAVHDPLSAEHGQRQLPLLMLLRCLQSCLLAVVQRGSSLQWFNCL